MKRPILTLGTMWLILIAAPLFAQTAVTSSAGVQFTASPDHAATLPDGTPILTRYEARFTPAAGGAAISPVNIGKPTPGAGNVILVKPIAAFGALSANVTYTLVVVAIGPGGEGIGPASDPFVRVVASPPAAPGKGSVVP